MLYTLILTAIFSSANGHRTAVHTEHDYPTYEACQTAYKTASAQLTEDAMSVTGTCLKTK